MFHFFSILFGVNIILRSKESLSKQIEGNLSPLLLYPNLLMSRSNVSKLQKQIFFLEINLLSRILKCYQSRHIWIKNKNSVDCVSIVESNNIDSRFHYDLHFLKSWQCGFFHLGTSWICVNGVSFIGTIHCFSVSWRLDYGCNVMPWMYRDYTE